MPTIRDLNYGFDANGVEKYLEEIKGIVLTKAAEKVKNISDIEKACNANWEGRAKEEFLENLKTDAEHVSEQYQNLYNTLVSEIQSVQASMANKDEALIED